MAFLPIKSYEGFKTAIENDEAETQKTLDLITKNLGEMGIKAAGIVKTDPRQPVTLTKRNSFINGKTFVHTNRNPKLSKKLHQRKNIAKVNAYLKPRQEQLKSVQTSKKDHLEEALDTLAEFGVSISNPANQTVFMRQKKLGNLDRELISGIKLFDKEHKLIEANRPLVENPINLKNYSINLVSERDLDAAEFLAGEYSYLFNVLEPGKMSLYSINSTKLTPPHDKRGSGAKIQSNHFLKMIAAGRKRKAKSESKYKKSGQAKIIGSAIKETTISSMPKAGTISPKKY